MYLLQPLGRCKTRHKVVGTRVLYIRKYKLLYIVVQVEFQHVEFNLICKK